MDAHALSALHEGRQLGTELTSIIFAFGEDRRRDLLRRDDVGPLPTGKPKNVGWPKRPVNIPPETPPSRQISVAKPN